MHTAKLRKSVNSGIVSATTALAANPARISYFVQNLGTNPLFVKEGTGASVTDFTAICAAGTVNDNGTAGSIGSPSDSVFVGAISIAGTTPRYTITERAENI